MKQKLPNYIMLLGWLITAVTFIIGFWHTHLGLREFRALSSNYGSLVIAGLIVMVIIVAYNRALSGNKSGLYFYLLCATFMFIFNLNSFYPSYLGRKLIKEEAIYLNDTLQSYANRLNVITGQVATDYIKDIRFLEDKKSTVLREIRERGGFGPEATRALMEFNTKSGSQISPDRQLMVTTEEREKVANYYDGQMKNAIGLFIVSALSTSEKNALQIYNAKVMADSIRNIFTEPLEFVIKDNSRVENIDSVRFRPDIKMFSELVTNLDIVVKNANTAMNNEKFLTKLRDETDQVPLPKTQELGRLAHTLSSVWERLGKLDTWGIIILCLFIDFVVPLAVYFLIRKGYVERSGFNKPRSIDTY